MNKKDCLLIVPPFQSGRGSILKSFKYSMPPIGLLSIAALLRQNGIKVSLLDFTVEDMKRHSVEDILLSHKKQNGAPGWIGISVCTPVAYSAYHVVDSCRKIFKDAQIVLGGPHVTVLKEEVFTECKNADYLIAGEGEYAFCNLIANHDVSAHNLFIKGENAGRAKADDVTVDLATLPMPAYDLLKFKKYVPPPASLKSRHPGIGIITGRGCPYKCSFCTKISGTRLRLRPIPAILEEIKHLKDQYKIKQFHFYDDTISCNRQFITELCDTFLKEDLNIHWSCFARVDTVDRELLGLMKKAGCFIIMYGAESMDETVLKSFNKGITVHQIENALEMTRQVAIESRISFIIGSPAETRDTLAKTKKEMLKLKADFLQVFIAVPMPGSQFYNDAKAEGRVISENWEDYNLSKVLYRHPVFTERELFKIQRQFYISFYLRPRILFNFLIRINSLAALKNIWKGFLGFVRIITA